ncbi:uncharacterized protein BDR25DRAFT_312427 [Lindgomyces ingoldianus]|uniref:Uncharacterized protein n=1 Tax=Lindgomyces ingoldianus TaxID=673940 RepID=A0ACB6R2Q7_9PLEO|nr:uncharacterized protein BDR25DRAFT_312427 [Lindgomyces ingoldianus]KAF2473342.1 hypothetical protein BDR25DRAFT_312427 [Lindgomyces ingoldianus]
MANANASEALFVVKAPAIKPTKMSWKTYVSRGRVKPLPGICTKAFGTAPSSYVRPPKNLRHLRILSGSPNARKPPGQRNTENKPLFYFSEATWILKKCVSRSDATFPGGGGNDDWLTSTTEMAHGWQWDSASLLFHEGCGCGCNLSLAAIFKPQRKELGITWLPSHIMLQYSPETSLAYIPHPTTPKPLKFMQDSARKLGTHSLEMSEDEVKPV